MATPFDSAIQRCNFDRFFAVDREMPVGEEFVAAQFDPRLHQTKLFSRQVTLDQLTGIDAEYRFLTLVLGMNVREGGVVCCQKNTCGQRCQKRR